MIYDIGPWSNCEFVESIEIGLEQPPFDVFVKTFSSFEHVKSLLIMGPNNSKNSSKSVIFSYLTMNNIVRIFFLIVKNTKFDQETKSGAHEQLTY